MYSDSCPYAVVHTHARARLARRAGWDLARSRVFSQHTRRARAAWKWTVHFCYIKNISLISARPVRRGAYAYGQLVYPFDISQAILTHTERR